MRIHSGLVLHNTPVAQLYYLLRSYDSAGSGWVKVKRKKVVRKLSISEGTLRRLLKQAKDEGWFQTIENRAGVLYVKYRAEDSLARALTVRSTAIASFPRRNLKSRRALQARAVHAHILVEQHKAEGKLTFSVRKGKYGDAPFIGHADVKRLLRQRLAQRPASREPIQAPADVYSAKTGRVFPPPIPGSYACTPTHIFAKRSTLTLGVAQETVARQLGLSRETVGKLLAGAPKMRVYKETNLAEAFERDDIYVYADDTAGKEVCIPFKPMPYVYIDNGITHRAHRAIVRKAKLLPRLSQDQLKAAMLGAIRAGFPHSTEGALDYIEKIGLKRFLKNTWTLDPKKVARTGVEFLNIHEHPNYQKFHKQPTPEPKEYTWQDYAYGEGLDPDSDCFLYEDID